jgi:hypothetical protein
MPRRAPPRQLRCAALLATGLAVLSMDVPATTIQRCLGADGTTIFTDRPCSALGATPAGTFNPTPSRSGDAPATLGLHGATGGFATRGCATSPDALLNGVRDALQARDVNRLANYYHWAGTGSGAAFALMERLERIANRPLAGVHLDYPVDRPVYSPEAEDFANAGSALPPPPRPVTALPETDPRNAAGPAFLASLRRTPRPQPSEAPGDTRDATPTEGSTPGPHEGEAGAGLEAIDATPPPRPAVSRPIGLSVLQASSSSDPGSAVARFGLRRNAGCWWIAF